MKVKVFNLMSRVNETSFEVQHESCKCKCTLNGNLSNSERKWHHDKCWYEYKELVNWSSCKMVIYGILD